MLFLFYLSTCMEEGFKFKVHQHKTQTDWKSHDNTRDRDRDLSAPLICLLRIIEAPHWKNVNYQFATHWKIKRDDSIAGSFFDLGTWIMIYICSQKQGVTPIAENLMKRKCLGMGTKMHSVFLDFESSGIKFWPWLFNRTSLYFSKYIYSSSWYLEKNICFY